MNRRIVIAMGLALSLGAIPLIAQGAQGPGQRPGGPGRGGPGGPGRGGPGGPGILAGIQQLDLTEAQREQIRALMDQARQGGDPGSPIRDAELKLHAAVMASPPDLQAIETLKAALNAAHAAELEHRVDLMLKAAQILTPAQRTELLDKRKSLGPPRARGRGHLAPM
jgi:Spy/CpxP family protein refolding chaperone